MSGDTETGWLRAPLSIRRDVLDGIHAHALRAYPGECCGFVYGPREQPALLNRATEEINEADKYHARDPETFPRTSKEYFKINGLRASRAFEQSASSREPLKVVYHSHCEAGDYFSAEDAATFASGGELLWPCAFIVVSVIGGEVKGQRLWTHVPGTEAFAEQPLTIIE
jgi:proteasome lid subunit RPN8/RPN11